MLIPSRQSQAKIRYKTECYNTIQLNCLLYKAKLKEAEGKTKQTREGVF